MGFEVVTATEPSENGPPNRRSAHPSNSTLAGEVKKKKFNPEAQYEPPPQPQVSGISRQLDLHEWRRAEANEMDNDEDFIARLPGAQRSEHTPLGNASQPSLDQISSSPSDQFFKAEKCRSAEQDQEDIKVFLQQHPQLQPYFKWCFDLERLGDGYCQVPHTALIFSERCESCRHHEDICTGYALDDNRKCNECRENGGRCVFRNHRGFRSRLGFECSAHGKQCPIKGCYSFSPDNSCGRCVRGKRLYVSGSASNASRDPYRASYEALLSYTELRGLEREPILVPAPRSPVQGSQVMRSPVVRSPSPRSLVPQSSAPQSLNSYSSDPRNPDIVRYTIQADPEPLEETLADPNSAPESRSSLPSSSHLESDENMNPYPLDFTRFPPGHDEKQDVKHQTTSSLFYENMDSDNDDSKYGKFKRNKSNRPFWERHHQQHRD